MTAASDISDKVAVNVIVPEASSCIDEALVDNVTVSAFSYSVSVMLTL